MLLAGTDYKPLVGNHKHSALALAEGCAPWAEYINRPVFVAGPNKHDDLLVKF